MRKKFSAIGVRIGWVLHQVRVRLPFGQVLAAGSCYLVEWNNGAMAVSPVHKLTKDERAELASVLDERPRILISARSPGGFVALLRDRMVVRTEQGWQLVGWSDIQRGGWDGEGQRLYWELVDGTRGAVIVNDPGDLPRAFAERVQASIVISRQIRLKDELGTIQLTGRRQPDSTDAINWHAEALGKCDFDDPAVQSAVLSLTEDMRAEYE